MIQTTLEEEQKSLIGLKTSSLQNPPSEEEDMEAEAQKEDIMLTDHLKPRKPIDIT